MINKEILREIGLTENESEIYLILLNLGEATIYKIADQSKISRPNIYDTMKKVIEKGLATSITKNKKKFFKPVAPEKLLEILKYKETNLLQILPDLKETYEKKKTEPIIEIFEGKEGLKTIMDDFIKIKKDILIFNPIDINYILKQIPNYYLKKFLNEKKRLNIKTKVLYSKEIKPIKGPGYKLKQLPELNLGCVGYWVYGERIVIGIWSESPIFIRIISKDVAQTYQKSIELIWNSI